MLQLHTLRVSGYNLKLKDFKNNILLIHGVGIWLKWRENMSFSLKNCFRVKCIANSVCLHFSLKPLPKKKIHKNSFLFNMTSQKCKVCLTIRINKYIFAVVLEKQPFRNISKIKLRSETAIKMNFSISLFLTCGEIMWNIPLTECDF